MVAASSTWILGSIIRQSDAIPAMAVGITTGNPAVNAELYSVGFLVCGVIEPHLLGATDVGIRGVLAVAMRDTLDVIPATAVARDAKAKHLTFNRWKSRKQMVRFCELWSQLRRGE
ncbi:MAG: hypothetical protein ACR2OA_02970 [Rubripirellula sp.]|jgi:hypothetical protein